MTFSQLCIGTLVALSGVLCDPRLYADQKHTRLKASEISYHADRYSKLMHAYRNAATNGRDVSQVLADAAPHARALLEEAMITPSANEAFVISLLGKPEMRYEVEEPDGSIRKQLFYLSHSEGFFFVVQVVDLNGSSKLSFSESLVLDADRK